MTSLPANINISSARLPATYMQAKAALANCARIDECMDWADKAAALASYAKQADDDEMMKMAVRVRDRAIRRAGELLKQVVPKKGANQNISAAGDTKVLTRKEAAEQAGMSKRQQVTAVRVASIPDDEIVLVPIHQLSDSELLGRAAEYDDMAKGCHKHALEIRGYVRAREREVAA